MSDLRDVTSIALLVKVNGYCDVVCFHYVIIFSSGSHDYGRSQHLMCSLVGFFGNTL